MSSTPATPGPNNHGLPWDSGNNFPTGLLALRLSSLLSVLHSVRGPPFGNRRLSRLISHQFRVLSGLCHPASSCSLTLPPAQSPRCLHLHLAPWPQAFSLFVECSSLGFCILTLSVSYQLSPLPGTLLSPYSAFFFLFSILHQAVYVSVACLPFPTWTEVSKHFL